jgi:drug/metabolite transporter (DMT)-like permease
MDELSTPKQASRRFSTSFEGAALMIFTCACFAGMSALIRDLSDEFSPIQIAFFRNAVGFLVLLPIMARVGFGALKVSRFKIFAIRGFVGVTAMWCWYTALGLTPLASRRPLR